MESNGAHGINGQPRGADPRRSDNGRIAIPKLSVVVPAFNEVENVEPLVAAVSQALEALPRWELIVVDDGSVDGTGEALLEASQRDARLRVAFHPERRGQTAALATGIDAARGHRIGLMDADLQTDPGEFLRLLDAMEDTDADAAVGYRVDRHDDWLRRVSSRVANAARNLVTGDSVRDTGCPLKVFRAEVLRDVPLFEGMHRFLPTLVRWGGHEVVEVPVSHRPRTRGRSKYGVSNRLWVATQDLVAVRWMKRRMITRSTVPAPAHPAQLQRARTG